MRTTRRVKVVTVGTCHNSFLLFLLFDYCTSKFRVCLEKNMKGFSSLSDVAIRYPDISQFDTQGSPLIVVSRVVVRGS